jgi:hypothetical protein
MGNQANPVSAPNTASVPNSVVRAAVLQAAPAAPAPKSGLPVLQVSPI